jgi:hypothetical protein
VYEFFIFLQFLLFHVIFGETDVFSAALSQQERFPSSLTIFGAEFNWNLAGTPGGDSKLIKL